MRIGVGDTTVTIAAVAVADTEVAVGPKKRINVVFTFLDTVTLMRLVGSLVESFTPGAEVGKVTATVSSDEPPKPLLRA
jgi:hypothetical protein